MHLVWVFPNLFRYWNSDKLMIMTLSHITVSLHVQSPTNLTKQNHPSRVHLLCSACILSHHSVVFLCFNFLWLSFIALLFVSLHKLFQVVFPCLRLGLNAAWPLLWGLLRSNNSMICSVFTSFQMVRSVYIHEQLWEAPGFCLVLSIFSYFPRTI